MIDLHGISQAADDLIVDEETGGEGEYLRTGENRPTWPGVASGVTILIGYDCGYSTVAEIAGDLGPYLPADVVTALQQVAGVRGSPARALAHELYWINCPWETAMAVYHERDVPKWVGICERTLPNFDLLAPDCKGALVSLAFNRGDSWNTPPAHDPTGRYVEMRAIKAHMIAKEFGRIPGEIRAMKRLWPAGTPDHNGLTARREKEAVLFEQGLRNAANPPPAAAPVVPSVAAVPVPAAPPPAKSLIEKIEDAL